MDKLIRDLVLSNSEVPVAKIMEDTGYSHSSLKRHLQKICKEEGKLIKGVLYNLEMPLKIEDDPNAEYIGEPMKYMCKCLDADGKLVHLVVKARSEKGAIEHALAIGSVTTVTEVIKKSEYSRVVEKRASQVMNYTNYYLGMGDN